MNLLPQLNNKIWTFKTTFAAWLLRSGVKPLIIYTSDNTLILSLFLPRQREKNTGWPLYQRA